MNKKIKTFSAVSIILVVVIAAFILLNIYIINPVQASIGISVSTSIPTDNWQSILVNSGNKLPQDFNVELSEIQGTYKVDKRIAEITKKMIADAKSDGISLQVCSAYRSVDKQTSLYTNKVNHYLNLGYSETDARKKAGELVAVPLTSEHHTGLAIDFNSSSYQQLDAGIEKTKEIKWLHENADRYGFILRYPKDKQNITKITYEPWHFRYVGIEAAKYIKENNLCLEEYLNR